MTERQEGVLSRTVIDVSMEVHAPLEVVSATMRDIDSWVAWIPGLKRLKRGAGPWRAGQKFTMVVKAAPFLPPLPIVCTTYEVAHDRIMWGVGEGSSYIRHSFAFRSAGPERTVVHQLEHAAGVWGAATLFAQPFIYAHDLRWQRALRDRYAGGEHAGANGRLHAS